MAVNGDKYDSIYTGEEIDEAIGIVKEAEEEGGVVSKIDLSDYVSSNFITNAMVTGDGSGDPSVTITKSGTANQTVLNFVFNDIKGKKGDVGNTGATGLPALVYNSVLDMSVDPAIGVVIGLNTAVLNRTPVESEHCNVYINNTSEDTSFLTDCLYNNTEGNQSLFLIQNVIRLTGKQGIQGIQGDTPSISASASVSNTTGTPSVTVTQTGTVANPVFNFAFSNLKGDKGDDGVVAARYIRTITSSNWSGSSAPYTFTIPASTHLKGKNCSVQIKDSSTGEVYSTTILIAPSNGDVTIKSNVKIGLIIEIFS